MTCRRTNSAILKEDHCRRHHRSRHKALAKHSASGLWPVELRVGKETVFGETSTDGPCTAATHGGWGKRWGGEFDDFLDHVWENMA